MTGDVIPQAIGQPWEVAEKMPRDCDGFSPRSSVQLRFLLPGQFCGAEFIIPGVRRTTESSPYIFHSNLNYD